MAGYEGQALIQVFLGRDVGWLMSILVYGRLVVFVAVELCPAQVVFSKQSSGHDLASQIDLVCPDDFLSTMSHLIWVISFKHFFFSSLPGEMIQF